MELLSGSVDEFEKLVTRMTTPRVVIDNAVSQTETIIKVDSARKHGILLDAIQFLTDLDLSIKKAYISSDGRWFMDVYHVTDLNGKKLIDGRLISCIEQALGSSDSIRANSLHGLTALELAGSDRVGLLSEVFAVLADLNCNVVEAKLWTHNGRIASLVHVTDGKSGTAIDDSQKIDWIESRLRNILKGDNDIQNAWTSVSMAATHSERRLHQMMHADRDYERVPKMCKETSDCPVVAVQNWAERGYSVISVQCKDRTRLLFDVVCTLTDMGYVVYHATIQTTGDSAHLEFCTRRGDGSPIRSETERQRVIICLQAAVERRSSKGLRLELCTSDRRNLLADVTRTFRENGLNVTRAEVSTSQETAFNVFYVTDAHGNSVDPKIIQSVREKIGLNYLQIKELPQLTYHQQSDDQEQTVGVTGAMLVSLGNLVRKNLYQLGLIRSFS